MRGITIREARMGDVKELAVLHVEAWKIAYAPILTQEHLDWVSVQREVRRKRSRVKDDTPFLVAEKSGQLLGFMVYSEFDDSDEAWEIDSLWVHHEFTRQGIGAKLIEQLRERERPKRIHVWVLTGVDAGPNFYERHGFRPEEETRQDFIFLDEPMPMVRYRKNCRYRKIQS
ncbi:MAG: GNAT family N-acetyltransferase [Planctomycetota bacterium]